MSDHSQIRTGFKSVVFTSLHFKLIFKIVPCALCFNLCGVSYFNVPLKASEVKGKCFDSYEFSFNCLCKESPPGCQWLRKVLSQSNGAVGSIWGGNKNCSTMLVLVLSNS